MLFLHGENDQLSPAATYSLRAGSLYDPRGGGGDIDRCSVLATPPHMFPEYVAEKPAGNIDITCPSSTVYTGVCPRQLSPSSSRNFHNYLTNLIHIKGLVNT
jgi:hypothetical protein